MTVEAQGDRCRAGDAKVNANITVACHWLRVAATSIRVWTRARIQPILDAEGVDISVDTNSRKTGRHVGCRIEDDRLATDV